VGEAVALVDVSAMKEVASSAPENRIIRNLRIMDFSQFEGD
jgi:hypothetical protein